MYMTLYVWSTDSDIVASVCVCVCVCVHVPHVCVYVSAVHTRVCVCTCVWLCVCMCMSRIITIHTHCLSVSSTLYHFYHTQVRQQQLLDTTAQKHKAYLSQGKGLQSRRLPSNLAEKVPEDYSVRRRAQTYSTNTTELRRSGRSVPSLSPTREETDSGDSMSAMTDEERKQKVKKYTYM